MTSLYTGNQSILDGIICSHHDPGAAWLKTDTPPGFFVVVVFFYTRVTFSYQVCGTLLSVWINRNLLISKGFIFSVLRKLFPFYSLSKYGGKLKKKRRK